MITTKHCGMKGKRWRSIPYLWIRRVNITSAEHSKLSYRLREIPIQIPDDFSLEVDKLILKFMWNGKGPSIGRTILNNSKQMGYRLLCYVPDSGKESRKNILIRKTKLSKRTPGRFESLCYTFCFFSRPSLCHLFFGFEPRFSNYFPLLTISFLANN